MHNTHKYQMSPLKYETIGRFSGFGLENFLEIRLYESKLYELKSYEMQLNESKLYEMLLSPNRIQPILKSLYFHTWGIIICNNNRAAILQIYR